MYDDEVSGEITGWVLLAVYAALLPLAFGAGFVTAWIVGAVASKMCGGG